MNRNVLSLMLVALLGLPVLPVHAGSMFPTLEDTTPQVVTREEDEWRMMVLEGLDDETRLVVLEQWAREDAAKLKGLNACDECDFYDAAEASY